MSTNIFPRVVRDWFMGLRSRSPKSETQSAAERAATHEAAAPDTEAPSGEEILRRAADNNDSNSRD